MEVDRQTEMDRCRQWETEVDGHTDTDRQRLGDTDR